VTLSLGIFDLTVVEELLVRYCLMPLHCRG